MSDLNYTAIYSVQNTDFPSLRIQDYISIGIFEDLWGKMWGREGDSDGGFIA
jgi:hypothetical protein